MSGNNGTASTSHERESRAHRITRLGRELAALIAELEALAVWAAGQEERQARLEILAAACEEERELMGRGVIWLSD